jgi:hypothetical protein
VGFGRSAWIAASGGEDGGNPLTKLRFAMIDDIRRGELPDGSPSKRSLEAVSKWQALHTVEFKWPRKANRLPWANTRAGGALSMGGCGSQLLALPKSVLALVFCAIFRANRMKTDETQYRGFMGNAVL